MAQIVLEIGGRQYELTVRSGQEEHFRKLGLIVDQRARAVVGSMRGVNEARQLLMTALLLADEIGSDAPEPAGEERAAQEPASAAVPLPAETIVPVSQEIAQTIDALADRVERLATRFERGDSAG